MVETAIYPKAQMASQWISEALVDIKSEDAKSSFLRSTSGSLTSATTPMVRKLHMV